jgi:Tfp pilus assembly protein PilO
MRRAERTGGTLMGGQPKIQQMFGRELAPREKVFVFVTALTLAAALLYQIPYRMLGKSIVKIAAARAAIDDEITSLSLQIADIKMHEAELKAGRTAGAVPRVLTDQRGVILLLDDVSSEARKQGVALISVRPAQEQVKDNYKEVSMNLDVKGRYRDLAAYFRHLENLSRIVNIRKLRIEACPDSSTACATQIEAVTYLEK